jgi:hypothetical protein
MKRLSAGGRLLPGAACSGPDSAGAGRGGATGGAGGAGRNCSRLIRRLNT